ncbi:MAG: riboflavin synthase [Betaproteobacteria bacterium]|nr:riboflavin synthase [Betaproteobacteria bacterium]
MFTGIVQALGKISRVDKREGGVRLAIHAVRLGMDDVAIGDSIAVNGVCLTVVHKTTSGFETDVSAETLRCAAGLDAPGEVNLEKSLRLADRLGGHIVSGHVDGMGEVVAFRPVRESHLLRIRAPKELERYIARKGSVTVQGVSLTVNDVNGMEFDINLIPHTLGVTTLKHLKPGAKVNLEVDMIARYVERILGVAQ